MHQCRHFDLEELVPPTTFEDRGLRAWELLDERILIAMDQLREDWGAIQVNTWKWGGPLMYRGFRPPECSIGARLSQHRYGRAIDFTPLEANLETVYNAIKDGEYHGITTLENIEATSRGNWIHIDCRNVTPIRIVNP